MWVCNEGLLQGRGVGVGWGGGGWWQVASTFLTCKEVLQRCEGLNTKKSWNNSMWESILILILFHHFYMEIWEILHGKEKREVL